MVGAMAIRKTILAEFFLLMWCTALCLAQDLGPEPDVVDATPEAIDSAGAEISLSSEWKLTSTDNVAIGLRVGSILWSGLSMPVSTTSKPVNINGINGKNFLYPLFPIFGIEVRIGLGQTIRLAPSIDLLVDEYVYRADLDRAFRTTHETGSVIGPLATVMGFLVSLPVWFDIPINDRLVLSLAPGIAAYPRVAIMALDKSSGMEKITEALNRETKWLYPETGIAIQYALGSWFTAGLQIQVLYPLYHAWASDGLPFEDGLMVIGTFSFDFYF